MVKDVGFCCRETRCSGQVRKSSELKAWQRCKGVGRVFDFGLSV